VVKTGRSEVKPPISPSSELVVPQSPKKMVRGKKVTTKLMPNVYTVQVCSVKTTTVKQGFDARTV
jgi:hypothetical protein